MASPIIAPIANESWQDHFLSRGWTTPQNQIDAGYPYFAQPTPASGTYTHVVDLGSLVAIGTIRLTYLQEAIAGTVTTSITIGYSSDGTSYTDTAASEVFASNFRYVRIVMTFTGSTDAALARISALHLRVDVKQKTDQGKVTALAADAAGGGTTVNFTKTFADIDSITVTPAKNASFEVFAVYNFTDVPNPTSFKVICYRRDTGAAVDNEVSWVARGV